MEDRAAAARRWEIARQPPGSGWRSCNRLAKRPPTRLRRSSRGCRGVSHEWAFVAVPWRWRSCRPDARATLAVAIYAVSSALFGPALSMPVGSSSQCASGMRRLDHLYLLPDFGTYLGAVGTGQCLSRRVSPSSGQCRWAIVEMVWIDARNR
jgi:hypothetical protein